MHAASALLPGDTVLIPAFWAHSVIHYPREGGSRNVALSFVKPGAATMKMRPFSADVLALWQAAQQPQDEGEHVEAASHVGTTVEQSAGSEARESSRVVGAGRPVRIEVGVDGEMQFA